MVRQDRRPCGGRADEAGRAPRGRRRRGSGFVEEHDEVDVGGVVQLPCPHLAHGEATIPPAVARSASVHSRQLAARDEGVESAEGGGGGGVGEAVSASVTSSSARRRRGRRARRGAPRGAWRCGGRGGVLRREGRGLGQEAVECGFGREGQRLLAPRGLAFEKAPEVRGAAARAADEVGQVRGQAREGAEGFRGEVGLERAPGAGEAGGEGAQAQGVASCGQAVRSLSPPVQG
jgi:hypothetical protein